jgi:gamma-glutamylaminecyclotransferase
MTIVFVFGTLKQGFPNAATNRGERLAGEFETLQAYPLHLVGERHSPWLIDAPGEGVPVRGQLFRVDDAVLADMDKLERISEPDGYRRATLVVRDVVSGTAIEVQAYLKPQAQWQPELSRLGPLAEYTLQHAALYRKREKAD